MHRLYIGQEGTGQVTREGDPLTAVERGRHRDETVQKWLLALALALANGIHTVRLTSEAPISASPDTPKPRPHSHTGEAGLRYFPFVRFPRCAGVAGSLDQQAPGWSFLTNHAHVLLAVARDPAARLRDIATACHITECTVQGIVVDLEQAGYLTRARDTPCTRTARSTIPQKRTCAEPAGTPHPSRRRALTRVAAQSARPAALTSPVRFH